MEFKELNLAGHQLIAIQEASRILQAYFPVQEVRLFGSFAKGEGTEDSDLDIFVLTTRPVSYTEKAAMSDAIFEINLQYGVIIHLLIASADEWNSSVWSQLPVYQDIRQEGAII
ncbi:MAG: nucleotidyltransferase domain-containing protein [Syntrophomonadaceae bacterium]|jgi:predicted nucleotidyltransferase|nr:nucleotidyltransferase domain-containing protein [Syntrophomonadaceae bacterium]